MRFIVSIIFIISFFSSYLFASSAQHENTENHTDTLVKFEQIEVEKSAKEFKIPSELWDQILNDNKVGNAEEAKPDESKHGEKKEVKKEEAPILVWLPVKVQLSAVSDDILKSKNIEYEFSMGGGDIDFSKIVVGEKGSFFVKFLLDEFKDPSKIKVFFYSRSKKRKIDDDIFGSGCNVYFEVTKKLLAENAKQGIKTNITDNRHISIFGGHFIFVSKNDGKIYLTQLSFKDSTKSEYYCQE